MPLDLKNGLTFRHHHVSLVFIFLILLICVIILMIKPAFLGYKLNSQFEKLGTSAESILGEVELLKSQLLIAKTNLETCTSLNEQYLANLNSEKNATFSCLAYRREQDALFDQWKLEYQFNLTQLRSQRENLEVRLTSLRTEYEQSIQNAASNICCKNRIDNPNIDSYIISNDRIVCAVGEGNKISC